MAIEQEVREEMKAAMRERDQPRLDVLRQIESEIAKAKTSPDFSGEVDDSLYQSTIAAYSKKMTKAMAEYEKAGERGASMKAQLAFEVEYLSRWLPKKLDEDQTRAVVQKAIDELGVSGAPAKGRVVGQVMKSHKGEVDGSLVNRIALELLG